MIDGMIIKMCRCNSTFHIICRMLNRSKFIDIMPVRKNDDTSRMLTCASSDSRTPFGHSFYLTFSFSLLMFLIVVPDKSIRCLICQSTDRSSLKCMSFTEKNFCIFMSLCLIISGKVQVDIRFFVSFES